MAYSELPPIEPESNRGKFGITIDSIQTLKGCCLNQVVEVRPHLVGQRFVCSNCNNYLTTKESNFNIWKDSKNKELSDEATIQMIQYNKPAWGNLEVERDLASRGINKRYTHDTLYAISIIQTPAEWFVNKTVQLIVPKAGVTLIVGKVKDEFANSKPTISQLSANLSRESNFDKWK